MWSARLVLAVQLTILSFDERNNASDPGDLSVYGPVRAKCLPGTRQISANTLVRITLLV
jgi:hypothetical protein